MNLRTLFAIPIAVLLLVTVSLAGMMAVQGWSAQQRGKAAVEAVERMRRLVGFQNSQRAERVVANLALGKAWPMPDAMRIELTNARRETDRRVEVMLTTYPAEKRGTDTSFDAVVAGLKLTRNALDALLARDPDQRSYAELNTMMPRMMAVGQAVDAPLERAAIAITRADPGLSGLMTLERLSLSLRDQVALIAAVLVPRFNHADRPTDAELDRVRDIMGRATYLTQLMNDTARIAGATDNVRKALDGLRRVDTADMLRLLMQPMDMTSPNTRAGTTPLLPQTLLVPWGQGINTLREDLLDAAVERVKAKRGEGETEFGIVLAGFGIVVVAILEAIISLRDRVVRPLAELGLAITRIAAGDRGVSLRSASGTREIAAMVTAVETLRQAALVADATVLRQRLLARQRLELWREALGIVRTVREPAHALEHGVASLCEGIDATIALVGNQIAASAATLETAAEAVRNSLTEMRQSSAGLDATFAAADEAQSEDRPQEELVAHIRAIAEEVDRREIAVRGFVHLSLMALRDTASATDEPRASALRALVSDQFERIEATVATIASMRDAVTRAAAIVRDLPADDTSLAA